jgi:hypothetical protein
MDRFEQDTMSDIFYGKIIGILENGSNLEVTINQSEYLDYPYSIMKGELFNFEQLILSQNKGKTVIKNICDIENFIFEIEYGELLKNQLILEGKFNKKRSKLSVNFDRIKVYNENNNEISLFDFWVSSGLNQTGVGIDFYLKDSSSKEEEEYHVKFNEELHDYLLKEESYWIGFMQRGPDGEFDLLIGLDEYGYKELTKEEIAQLIDICEAINIKYNGNVLIHQKVRHFAQELKKLCEEANKLNRLIMACGD